MDSNPTCIHGITVTCGRCSVQTTEMLQQERAILAPVEPFRSRPTNAPPPAKQIADDMRKRAKVLHRTGNDLHVQAAELLLSADRIEKLAP